VAAGYICYAEQGDLLCLFGIAHVVIIAVVIFGPIADIKPTRKPAKELIAVAVESRKRSSGGLKQILDIFVTAIATPSNGEKHIPITSGNVGVGSKVVRYKTRAYLT
jgi:hypothetical protein